MLRSGRSHLVRSLAISLSSRSPFLSLCSLASYYLDFFSLSLYVYTQLLWYDILKYETLLLDYTEGNKTF